MCFMLVMKKYKWSTRPAIAFVKEREIHFEFRYSAFSHLPHHRTGRPRVWPNSGFVKQLDAFEACDYDPTPSAPAYIRWKDVRERDITDFMGSMVEMTSIISHQLFLNM